jgi:hypothetical protein
VAAVTVQHASVSKIASDQERGIYFWKIDGIQCCSHATHFTPRVCELHSVAFDTVCPSCRAQGTNGRTGAKPMLEATTTEREIEFELTDEEKEKRRAAFEEAWEKEQTVKAKKAVEVLD